MLQLLNTDSISQRTTAWHLSQFQPENEEKNKQKKQLLYKISESESESYVSPTLGYWFFRTACRERLLWND